MLLVYQGENIYVPQGPLLWNLLTHSAMLQMILIMAILLVHCSSCSFSLSSLAASENRDVLYNMSLSDQREWAALNL